MWGYNCWVNYWIYAIFLNGIYLFSLLPMNSRNLKKTYSKSYENFFLENSLVLSTPFVMNRSGDLLNNYSGVSIKQKVPLRIYIGWAKNSSGKITLGTMVNFDFDEYSYIETPLREYAPYFNDIDSYIQKNYGHIIEKHWWFEINMLSELPRWVGLWFGSILALLLSLLLNCLEDESLSQSLPKLTRSNINESLHDQYWQFAKIAKDAREFDTHIYNMMSSGTKFASFFNAYYPIISFAQDFDKRVTSKDEHHSKYFWFRFQDLFNEVREVPYSPIDYGIVYSGKPVLLEQIAGDNYKNNTMLASEIKSMCKNLFWEYLDHVHPQQRPRFYKQLIQSDIDEFELTYGKLMWIISLKMLYFMSKMYINGYDEANMLNFLDTIKKLRQWDSVTRHSSEVFLSFIKKILEKFSGSARYLSLAPNDSTIMWWSLIYAMPLEWFRTSIQNAVQSMNQEFPSAKILYANRLDGIESEWAICEQDLRAGLFSEFIAVNSCSIRRTNGKVLVWEYEKLIDTYKTGLLLDTINNKIYFNGQKLTSQDLHSQSATIEILRLLINNTGKDLSNDIFPSSSYSKNKNEMFGKIVIPLIDLIYDRCKKRLPLICKGSIYEFYLKLNSSDIEIAIVEELKKD